MSLARCLCALLLLIVATPGCRPQQAGLQTPRVAAAPLKLTEEQEARAEHLYRTLKRAEQKHDHAAATAMRDELLGRYPTSEVAAILYEERAQAAERIGAFAEAIDQYEHLLLLRPHFARIEQARQAYALLLVRVGRADDALHMYEGIAPAAEGNAAESARQELGRALIAPLLEAHRPELALRMAIEAHQYAGASAHEQEAIQERMPALVEALSDAQVEALLHKYASAPAWQRVMPRLALRLAKSPLLAEDQPEQQRLLRGIVRADPQSPAAEEANRLLAQASAMSQLDANTIGVLLPLSGRFKQFGERSLAAIELALQNENNIHLLVKDTEGDPNIAMQAVESLVFEHHVVAAIGPMFSAESVAAASRAEALRLPLLSLSHQEDLTKTGRFIFRTALTVGAQAKALAKTAFEELGMRRFAFLAPKNRFGLTFLQAFWDEVEAREGQIRGVEFYEPDATTFRQPIRKLVGRWFLNARPEFREALDALKEQELTGVRMRSEVAKLDKKTRPIIDFDGLVVPDSGRQLGLIAPALAFEDIALSHDAKELEKMRKTLNQNELNPITLLGASTWNNQQTLDACERYCESAVFVDAYFSSSTQPAVRGFYQAFQQKTGAEPLLSEAQAFDTAALLLRVLKGEAATESRTQLVGDLHALEDYEGVCGHMHFDPSGEIQRDLQSLTIHARHIEPLSTAASSLPPAPVRGSNRRGR